MKRLLALDLSTNSTGYALFNLETKELIEYGSISPKIPGLSKMKYPEAALYKILDITQAVKELINSHKPSLIVIEEVNRGINRIAQKSLDALHFFILRELISSDITPELASFDIKTQVVYYDSNGKEGWRGDLGLKLSPKDKEQNKLAKAIKKKRAGDMIPDGVKAKTSNTVDWKVLAQRFVNEKYKLNFNVEENSKDADICDAICVGHAYLSRKK